jgi:hypothetical protein
VFGPFDRRDAYPLRRTLTTPDRHLLLGPRRLDAHGPRVRDELPKVLVLISGHPERGVDHGHAPWLVLAGHGRRICARELLPIVRPRFVQLGDYGRLVNDLFQRFEPVLRLLTGREEVTGRPGADIGP